MKSQTGDPWQFQRWAFEIATGNIGRKAVLVALAVMADVNTGRCEARQDTIAQQVEAEERTVRRHLRDLETAGLIARRHQYRVDGRRRNDEFLLLAPWVETWPDGGDLPAKLAGSEEGTTGQNRQSLPDKIDSHYRTETPPLEQPQENNHLKNSPPPMPPPWKGARVNRKTVTKAEGDLADAILAAFNERAKLDLSFLPVSNGNLSMIVGRCREYPELTIENHRAIIAAVFAGNHWWEAPARLGIIYNPKQFSTAMSKHTAAPVADWAGDALLERSRKLYDLPPQEAPA